MIAAVSKTADERNAGVEEPMRNRHAEIKLERQELVGVLTKQFPDYVALADPQPFTPFLCQLSKAGGVRSPAWMRGSIQPSSLVWQKAMRT